MQVETVRVRGERAEKNKRFANDGSFESVDRLLAKLAIKCFARVQAMGLGMTIEDVRQEMNMSYVMAKKLWEPDRGILFATYLTTACYRNFGDRIRKAELERRHLGLVNMTDMRPVHMHDDEDMDPSEYLDNSDTDTYHHVTQIFGNELIDGGFMQGKQEAPLNADPSVFLEELQEYDMAKEKARNALTSLTPKAKEIVVELLTAARTREAGKKLPALRTIFMNRKTPHTEAQRIRKELAAAFGARL